jgi:tetratricopeptide (TPR) repeat protein
MIGGCSPATADESVEYYNKGKSYAEEGNWDGAIVWYKKAIRLKPDYKSAHIRLGYAYMKKERYEEAIASYDEAKRLDPKDHRVSYFMGSAYEKWGKWDYALASYEEAIRQEPEYVLAHYGLGKAQVMTGDREKAQEEHRWLREREPELADKLSRMIAKNAAKFASDGYLDLSSFKMKPSHAKAGSEVSVELDYTVSGSKMTVLEERRVEKDGLVLARFRKTYSRVPGRHQSQYTITVPGSSTPGAYTIVGSVTAGGQRAAERAILRVAR